MSQYSSVSKVAGFMTVVVVFTRAGIYFTCSAFRLGLGATHPSIQRVSGTLFAGAKKPELVLPTHFHLEPQQKMHGVLPPHLHTSYMKQCLNTGITLSYLYLFVANVY
jgi:hypothetical protein